MTKWVNSSFFYSKKVKMTHISLYNLYSTILIFFDKFTVLKSWNDDSGNKTELIKVVKIVTCELLYAKFYKLKIWFKK
jgi:hypothetical protein